MHAVSSINLPVSCKYISQTVFWHDGGWESKERILSCEWPWFGLTGKAFSQWFLFSPDFYSRSLDFHFEITLGISNEPVKWDVDIHFCKTIHFSVPHVMRLKVASRVTGGIKEETELWYTRLWMLEETKGKPSYSLISWHVSISAANWTVTLIFNY